MKSILLIFAFLSAMTASTSLSDDVDDVKLNKVRAAFVLNFIRYTDWPDETLAKSDALRVILIGGEAVANPLQQTLAGKEHEARKINTELRPADQLLAANALEQLSQVHVVVLGEDARIDPAKIKQLTSQGVLVVGIDPQAVKQGALFSMSLADGKVIFHAHPEITRVSPLKFSSKLLSLAKPLK
jgi:YfiR/HmsC-like